MSVFLKRVLEPPAYGWTREQFLRAVCEKAGLSPDTWRKSWVRLEAFEAEVWGEEER